VDHLPVLSGGKARSAKGDDAILSRSSCTTCRCPNREKSPGFLEDRIAWPQRRRLSTRGTAAPKPGIWRVPA